MKRFFSLFCALLLLFTLLTLPVGAHSGSLDANGGHYNHATGEYHFHNGTTIDSTNGTASGIDSTNGTASGISSTEFFFSLIILAIVFLIYRIVVVIVRKNIDSNLQPQLDRKNEELAQVKEALEKANEKIKQLEEAKKKENVSAPGQSSPPSSDVSKAPDARLQRFGEIVGDPHELFPRFIFSEEQQANYYQSIAKNALGRIDQSNFTVKRNFLQIPTVDIQNATEKNGLSNVYMTGKASLGIEIESHQEDHTTKTYVTTLTSCTCEDFVHNKHENPDTPCKHMVFFAQKIGALYLYRDQAAKLLDGKIDELKQLAANTSPKTKNRQPKPPKQ